MSLLHVETDALNDDTNVLNTIFSNQLIPKEMKKLNKIYMIFTPFLQSWSFVIFGKNNDGTFIYGDCSASRRCIMPNETPFYSIGIEFNIAQNIEKLLTINNDFFYSELESEKDKEILKMIVDHIYDNVSKYFIKFLESKDCSIRILTDKGRIESLNQTRVSIEFYYKDTHIMELDVNRLKTVTFYTMPNLLRRKYQKIKVSNSNMTDLKKCYEIVSSFLSNDSWCLKKKEVLKEFSRIDAKIKSDVKNIQSVTSETFFNMIGEDEDMFSIFHHARLIKKSNKPSTFLSEFKVIKDDDNTINVEKISTYELFNSTNS